MDVKKKERHAEARRRLHTTVFSQCFSPCGKFLAAADNFGFISLFSLGSALSPEANEDSLKPCYSFTAHDKNAIHCLASTDRLLISGGNDCIKAWLWTDLIAKSHRLVWSFTIASEERIDRFGVPETNCLAVDTQESGGRLLAGCGDNLVHAWDLETGQEQFQLRGHTDYIHCVTTRNSGRDCVTASQDGTLRIFDTRSSQNAIHTVEPNNYSECCRPEFGRWLGCVAVDRAEDWMVCGGGPRLCMWHLRSLAPTTVFDTPGACSNTVMFSEDSIISAGSEPFIKHWSLNGECRAQVPCTPSNVFSVVINDKADTNKVLAISGNCHKLDICTNFGYKAFSLSVC